jgi:hypothetical protein
MNTKKILILVAVVAVALGGYVAYQEMNKPKTPAEKMEAAAEMAVEAVEETFTESNETVGETVDSVIESVGEAVEDAATAVEETVEDAVDSASDTVDETPAPEEGGVESVEP